MNDDVLKQFVVGLGWKIDQQGERRVTETIASITKQAGLLALALEAAALAAAAAVAKIAASFDTLYYTSARTGASVQNIKGLSFALSQVGGSSGQATAAVESFARAMRTNPGVGQFVKDLGVTTTAGGKARDTIDVLADSIEAIQKKHPYYVGAQMAGLLGIDESTFNTLSRYRKEIKTYRDDYDRFSKQFGLNNKEASESSNAFMHSLRSLGTLATVVGERLLVALAPAMDRMVRGVLNWIDAHPEQIEKIFNGIATAAEWVSRAFGFVFDKGGELFAYLSKKAEELNADGSFLRTWEKIATVFDRVVTAIQTAITWLKELERATDTSQGLRAIGRLLGFVDASTSGAVQNGLGTLGSIDRATATNVGVPAGAGGEKPGWWRRTMPTWLGGDPSASGESGNAGSGIGRRGRRAAEADKTNYNFTGENADVLKQAAAQLGTSPEDLATVISYESKFNSKRWGGKGGNYLGLIQFGKSERDQFGVNDQQSFKEQMPAVVRFLKTRGFKPGMGLMDLYSTINAGSPGRYNASDGNGTVRSHTERMRTQEAARVARFLASGGGSGAPAAPAPPVNFPKLGFNPSGFDVNALGAAPALGGNSTTNSNTVTMNHNTTVKIDAGGDPATAGAQVERAVNRSNDLSLRNAQTAIR